MLRRLVRAMTSQYQRIVITDLLKWRRGRIVRTRAEVIRQYSGSGSVDLAQPLIGVSPRGEIVYSTVGDLRGHRWQLIADTLRELGVNTGVALEVGAGDGTNLRGLRRLMPSVSWWGCDLVPRHPEIVAADAVQLPFGSESCDVVLTILSLEQMPGDVGWRTLEEIARVSKRWLVSIEPDYGRASWAQRLYMIRRDYIREIVRPAAAAGFQLVRRQWTYGNPLNRPSMFVFEKRASQFQVSRK